MCSKVQTCLATFTIEADLMLNGNARVTSHFTGDKGCREMI